MKTVIWWIRRDLRLHDNQALLTALSNSTSVIPLFILDPHLLNYEARARKSFLFESLDSLSSDLQQRGSRLIIREGEPILELQKFFLESASEMIFAEADYSPYAKKRDSGVAEVLPCEFVPGLTIHPPDSVQKADGTPYTIFTPYKNVWRSLPKPGIPFQAPIIPFPASIRLDSIKIPSYSPSTNFPCSESEAHDRFKDFFQTGFVLMKRIAIVWTSTEHPVYRLT